MAVSVSTQRSGVLVLSMTKHKTLAQLALSDGTAVWDEVDKSS